MQTYAEKVEYVLRLAKKEAKLTAGFFGVVCLFKMYLQFLPVHIKQLYSNHCVYMCV